MKHVLPVKGEWAVFDDKKVALISPGAQAGVEKLKKEYAQNKLAYFVAHGVKRCDKRRVMGPSGRFVLPKSKYPKAYANDGVAFLNDWKHDGQLMVGPNQQGKTYLLAAWTGLKVVPCDPSWPVFSEEWGDHRIKCPEWEGPKQWVVASYSWDNVGTLWDRIHDIFPKEELGIYAERPISFGDGRPKHLPLKCGSKITFLCYTQAQCHWEGFSCDGGSFDEQCPKDKWIGWSRGTTTRIRDDKLAPFAMSLTGHVLPDRPDTGAAGWIKAELYDGRNTMGRDIARYHLSVDSTPDAIVSKTAKKILRAQWVDPNPERTEKEEREALARYWGGWEPGSGLLFGPATWDRDVHVISPLWSDNDTPSEFTLYRVIDYADVQTTACGWFAVAPKFAVLYRVLYEKEMLVAEAARRIVEMSGNTRKEMAPQLDEATGNVVQHFIEEQTGEQYYRTLLDSRASKWRQQGEPVAALFERYGVADVEDAPGAPNDEQIPALKDWLRIDYAKAHPFRKDANGEKVMGCPKLFFFDGICDPFAREIEEMPEAENGNMNKRKAHDGIDVLKYWAFSGPIYDGDAYKEQYDDNPINTTPFTGY